MTLVIAALLLAVTAFCSLMSCTPEPAIAAPTRTVIGLPPGYIDFGEEMAEVQQQIYGPSFWSARLLAQIEQESGWRRCPRSVAGARGPAQFMPQTQRAVERKYRISGNVCDPTHAAMLQSYLMRENAIWCAPIMEPRSVWGCSFRIYNGSPAAFAREWVMCGKPRNVERVAQCRYRKPAFHWENVEYPQRIEAKFPKYRAAWGR